MSSTRKVKPIRILLKQETVSGSGISWAICKSAPHSRQIATPATHYSRSFTGQMPFLPPNQQRQSTEGMCRAVLQCNIKQAESLKLSAEHGIRRDEISADKTQTGHTLMITWRKWNFHTTKQLKSLSRSITYQCKYKRCLVLINTVGLLLAKC